MLLLLSLACSTKDVGLVVSPANAGDTTTPLDEWLPGTSWSCSAISSLGGTKYVVANEWSFTATTWSSDISDNLAAAANSGYLPQFVGQAFFDWIKQDDTGWSRLIDTTDRHWFGVTDSTLLMELTASDSNDATPMRFKIERYTATDGTTRAEFSMPAITAQYAIDCAESD